MGGPALARLGLVEAGKAGEAGEDAQFLFNVEAAPLDDIEIMQPK